MEGLQGLEGMKVQYVLEIGQYQMLIFVSNAYSIDKTDRTIIIDHNRSMWLLSNSLYKNLCMEQHFSKSLVKFLLLMFHLLKVSFQLRNL